MSPKVLLFSSTSSFKFHINGHFLVAFLTSFHHLVTKNNAIISPNSFFLLVLQSTNSKCQCSCKAWRITMVWVSALLSCLPPSRIWPRWFNFLLLVQENRIQINLGVWKCSVDLFLFGGEFQSQKQWIHHHSNRTETHEGSSNWRCQNGPSYWQ